MKEDAARLERRLLAELSRASLDYDLIEPDDRVMVAISGGKDSWTLLHLLRRLQAKVPFEFSIVAVNLDQGHPGFPAHLISDYLVAHGYEHRMLQRDTYSVVKEKVAPGKTQCSLCSRLRRGILYDAAVELGATKIALGHHRDDVTVTLLLNLFYAGQMKAMPPRLRSDDGRNVVIRPLITCAEADIAAYAAEVGFPIIPCDLCGSQPNLYRQRIKALLDGLERDNPTVKANMMAAMANVRPSHLLDPELRRRYGLDDPSGVDEAFAALDGGGCDATAGS